MLAIPALLGEYVTGPYEGQPKPPLGSGGCDFALITDISKKFMQAFPDCVEKEGQAIQHQIKKL